MVKQVGKKSEAAAAGFKAFDVILKVGADSILTSADWDHALRSNQGKPVQVTILRDKKQQTITLQVDSKHRGAVEFEDLFADSDVPELADLAPAIDPDMMRSLIVQAEAEANAATARVRQQADAMRKQLGDMQLQMSQEQVEQLRQQTERLRECMKNLRIDPKQIQELQQQMDRFRKSLSDEQMKQLQQQMQRFKQQMEEWSEQSAGHFV
jgi:C-terminal processing protease CtpA/Prc